jgi:hypothetical protein
MKKAHFVQLLECAETSPSTISRGILGPEGLVSDALFRSGWREKKERMACKAEKRGLELLDGFEGTASS